MKRWDYAVRCRYGKRATWPKEPGAVAIETRHIGEHSRDMEIAAGKGRQDIGRVEWRDLSHPDRGWLIAYDEETGSSDSRARRTDG